MMDGGARAVGRIGPYRLVRRLGRGGMGDVHEAAHEASGAVVALKTVRVPAPALLGAIRREIAALARLEHPGIVRIVEQGVHDGSPWYAMELASGTTLRDWVAWPALAPSPTEPLEAAAGREREAGCVSRAGGGSLTAVLELARRLCAPLRYLHGEGLVHRDLKPDNVLVGEDGTPILIDLGLIGEFAGAGSRESLELTGEIAGTAAYMAPEQARGDLVDARADLYALGCILYELVTGLPPFTGPDNVTVLLKHQNDPPFPASRLVTGVPADLDALLLWMLAKDPRERPGYADDVAARLAAIGAAETHEAEAPAARTYVYRAALAGRREPLARLTGAIEALARGRGAVELLEGESGVGKTRLLSEAVRQAASRRMLVVGASCSPGGDEPLRGILLAIADHCRSRGGSEVEAVLGDRRAVLGQHEPALLCLPGQVRLGPPPELPPEAGRQRLFAYLRETLAALARRTKLLLVVDDAQWADAISLALLADLPRLLESERLPLLAVIAHRREEVPPPLRHLVKRAGVERTLLGRLDADAVREILRDMLALPRVPQELALFLERQSEGNPYFVSEYVRSAIDHGQLRRNAEGRWQIGEHDEMEARALAALPLPGSLRALVLGRIEALSVPARRLLDAAVVAGDGTAAEVIGDVSALAEATLDEAWAELRRAGILHELPGGVHVDHGKVREVAYEALSAERRPELHRAVALALEEAGDEELVRRRPALGRHWQLAGETVRAREHYLVGARAAAARHAHELAERLYTSYLELAEAPSAETARARGEIARILWMTGQASAAEAASRLSIAEAHGLGLSGIEADARLFLGTSLGSSGRIAEACEELERARAMAREHADRRAEGVALTCLANIRRAQDAVDEARVLYGEGLARLRESAAREKEAWALVNLGALERKQGRHAEAADLFQAALAMARGVGSRSLECGILVNVAGLLFVTGRDVEANAAALQAASVAHGLGDLWAEAAALDMLAQGKKRQRCFDEARAMWERALAVFRWSDRTKEGLILDNIGEMCWAAGDWQGAHDCFTRALQVARDAGDHRAQALALVDLAALEVFAGGEACVPPEVEPLLSAMRDEVSRAILACSCGRLALAAGQDPAPWLERSRAVARELGLPPGSELGTCIASLERDVAARAQRRPLVCATRPEELTPGQYRWLLEHRPDAIPDEVTLRLDAAGNLRGADASTEELERPPSHEA